ncbi:MAG: alpha-isopropylmalate synthase regulatory domain-containing protein [Halothermotrichaceae bacterium]
MRVEVMDTTLRDGEQTSGVAFKDVEKLSIAKVLLKEVKVNRIEVASARVSKGETEAVKKITSWAKKNDYLDRVEVLGFIDGSKSLDWIKEAGGKVVNLLCKGSLEHVKVQLNKSFDEHISDIKKEIQYASKLGIKVNIYLEDWSNGMKNSPDYVFSFVEELKDEAVERFMLPDTLGILNPDNSYKYCQQMIEKFPDICFDFHAHNDYGLAIANTLEAVKAGMDTVHTTVNGLGERTGNAPLSNTVAALHDHLQVETTIVEKNLREISKLVESFSGERIPPNMPVLGDNVFTQVCGVHADGDNKGQLYFNDLLPERFGRTRKYALGKTSGKASIRKNLEELGIELEDDDLKKVTQEVIELGDKKNNITLDDLPYIISEVLGSSLIEEKVRLENFSITNTNGLSPIAIMKINIDGEVFEETSTGDGQYDAFMGALTKVYDKLGRKLPILQDYLVTIPPGGKTSALVETVITWVVDGREFKTKSLDPDQTTSAIKATMKMLNIIENNGYNL